MALCIHNVSTKDYLKGRPLGRALGFAEATVELGAALEEATRNNTGKPADRPPHQRVMA